MRERRGERRGRAALRPASRSRGGTSGCPRDPSGPLNAEPEEAAIAITTRLERGATAPPTQIRKKCRGRRRRKVAGGGWLIEGLGDAKFQLQLMAERRRGQMTSLLLLCLGKVK